VLHLINEKNQKGGGWCELFWPSKKTSSEYSLFFLPAILFVFFLRCSTPATAGVREAIGTCQVVSKPVWRAVFRQEVATSVR
jgi:hypothetical protein